MQPMNTNPGGGRSSSIGFGNNQNNYRQQQFNLSGMAEQQRRDSTGMMNFNSYNSGSGTAGQGSQQQQPQGQNNFFSSLQHMNAQLQMQQQQQQFQQFQQQQQRFQSPSLTGTTTTASDNGEQQRLSMGNAQQQLMMQKLEQRQKYPSEASINEYLQILTSLEPSDDAKTSNVSKQVLEKCNWQEKTIHIARTLLGGSGVNGFLRATSSVQRLKKQRQRKASKKENSEEKPAVFSEKSEEDEALKFETMNPRTAKKIRNEIMGGISFCSSLIAVVESVLKELDPDQKSPVKGEGVGQSTSMPPPRSPPLNASFLSNALPMQSNASGMPSPKAVNQYLQPPSSGSSSGLNTVPPGFPNLPFSASDNASGSNSNVAGPGLSSSNHTAPETVEAGNPSGSTLRKLRKSTSTDLPPPPPSSDEKLTKKEVAYRNFEITRFRSLQKGDYVAARFSSRDLYIVVRVVKEWVAPEGISPKDIIGMNEAKRSTVYKDKVLVQDVEEYDGDIRKARAVARHHILPLPRTYSEAAEWGTRCRKGSRVYAMYPSTTSLYCATVIDSTTYCRGDDDIIVVEFDGDEDDFGKLPQRHIPARFVTLIPQELPSARVKRRKPTSKKNSDDTPLKKKRPDNDSRPSSSSKKTSKPKKDEDLNSLIDQMAYGEWNDAALDVEYPPPSQKRTPHIQHSSPQPAKKARALPQMNRRRSVPKSTNETSLDLDAEFHKSDGSVGHRRGKSGGAGLKRAVTK